MPPFPLREFKIDANTPLAEDIFELRISPADGQPVAPFVAGQWVGVKLPDDPDPTQKIVALSIASAPIESTEQLTLTIKVHGTRTCALRSTMPGASILVQGPFGMFTLRPGSSRLVFFAGGVGVTPFRSMVRQCLLSHDSRELVLFYTNRTRSSTVYEQEFFDLAVENKNFSLIPILTREKPDGWKGETHRIDVDMIHTQLGEIRQDDEFLMCGSQEFMDTVKQSLVILGVDVQARLRKESFH